MESAGCENPLHNALVISKTPEFPMLQEPFSVDFETPHKPSCEVLRSALNGAFSWRQPQKG
jgi:hypothetical protein